MFWCYDCLGCSYSTHKTLGTSPSHLSLFGCKKLTDVSVIGVAKSCKNIRAICLTNCTEITDEGIKEIANNCEGLTYLDLFQCVQVTNVGLSSLSNLPNLQTLWLPNRKTPLKGKEAISQYLNSLGQ